LPAQEAVTTAVKAVTEKVENVTDAVTRDRKAARSVTLQFRRVLETDFFGFTLGQLLSSFCILLAFLAFRGIVISLILRGLRRLAARKKNKLNEDVLIAIERPLSLFLLLLGIYLAVIILPLEATVIRFAGNVIRAAGMATIVWALVRLTDLIANQIGDRLGSRPGSAAAGFAPLIKRTLRIFVLIVGVLMVVDNLGYNLTGLIATLGLGTAAVALAAQDSIKNGFGAFMIVLDRPFKVGDWIQVGDKIDGNVESIGLRSTKVRTFPKTIVSIPNGVLANESIDNWSKMPKRRVKQTVGVTYESTAADMEGLVEDIRDLLRADEGVHPEFILVNFTDFGPSSLDILVYYFTRSTAWLEYMDVRQRINCKIMRAIHNRGLTIAFPSTTLYLDGPVASRLANQPYESRWDLGATREVDSPN
ncbi:MAG: mechanosensitive ion channel family protein, partial [Chthoniobacterales bacterium]